MVFLVEAALREERLERIKKRRRLPRQLNIIPDLEFVKNYRLNRGLFEELCREIVPLLPPKARRDAIDPTVKVLTALNFYARGSYRGSVGQNVDALMAQQTVSRCLKQVTNAINAPHILRKFIHFPQNRHERNGFKQGFFDKYENPGVIGCIDCTHIAIVRPTHREDLYFNRKHFHSINTQVICDSDCYITNLDASYGGQTHDAFIWGDSEIKSHLESLQNESSYLLGDSGYAQREYMKKPTLNAAEDSPEGRYNIIQKRAWSTIERTFGILEGRWRCLLAAWELHYCPETASNIILACCVLHNLSIIEAAELTEDESDAERRRQPTESVTSESSSVQALVDDRRARALFLVCKKKLKYFQLPAQFNAKRKLFDDSDSKGSTTTAKTAENINANIKKTAVITTTDDFKCKESKTWKIVSNLKKVNITSRLPLPTSVNVKRLSVDEKPIYSEAKKILNVVLLLEII